MSTLTQNPYAYDELAADGARLCAIATARGLDQAATLAYIHEDVARFVAERVLGGGSLSVNPSSAAALRRAIIALEAG